MPARSGCCSACFRVWGRSIYDEDEGEVEDEELEGSLVVAVVNFPPRQIGPVRSEVLVLGAVEDDGTVLILRPDGAATPGSRIA